VGSGGASGSRARGRGLLGACAVLLLAGCGETATEPAPGAELTIHASLPLRGPFAADGRDAADGARLALADAQGEAAGFAVRLELLDDTAGAANGTLPSPVKASANARAAAEDSTAIAYLGELTSGATRGSLPVTNEARILHVSPGAGAIDLVTPFRGTDEVPGTQPRGERNFGRVIPADDVQAAAAASWARKLGTRRAIAGRDGSDYGDEVTQAFQAAAMEDGIRVSRTRLFPEPARVVEPVFDRTDLVFYAGTPRIGGDLVDFADVAGAETVIGSDAIVDPRFLAGGGAIRSAGRAGAPSVRALSAALDPTHLPAAGARFAQGFEDEYGRAPGRFAAYGYEAMAVVLDALKRASDPADREAVTDAFFATEERASVLGTYSVTELGETTLDRFTGYRLEGGRWRPEAELAAP